MHSNLVAAPFPAPIPIPRDSGSLREGMPPSGGWGSHEDRQIVGKTRAEVNNDVVGRRKKASRGAGRQGARKTGICPLTGGGPRRRMIAFAEPGSRSSILGLEGEALG